jgi:hypothetical protein
VEANMNQDAVLEQIRKLHENGVSLSKKKVKQSHPDLMRNALYYFPSWEHALQASGLDTHSSAQQFG